MGRWFGLDLFGLQTGPNHGDELGLMFHLAALPFDTVYTEGDKNTSLNLLTLWTQFAKNQDPTPDSLKGVPKWERVVPGMAPKHMDISSLLRSETDSKKYQRRLAFWEKVSKLSPPDIHRRMELPETWKNPKVYKKPADDPATAKEEL